MRESCLSLCKYYVCVIRCTKDKRTNAWYRLEYIEYDKSNTGLIFRPLYTNGKAKNNNCSTRNTLMRLMNRLVFYNVIHPGILHAQIFKPKCKQRPIFHDSDVTRRLPVPINGSQHTKFCHRKLRRTSKNEKFEYIIFGLAALRSECA